MSEVYFRPIDGHTLLRSRGVYSEHQLYVDADNRLFARKGNGYIRLMSNNATSKSNVFWSDYHLKDRSLVIGQSVGSLVVENMPALPRMKEVA